MSRRRDARREAARIELDRHPEGMLITELADALSCSIYLAYQAVHDLRHANAGDPVTVVATPTGWRRRWLYSLSASVITARPWIRNRLRDMESRGETNLAVASSIVVATADDPSTVEAREARIWERCYRRALEDLADIHGGPQPTLPLTP